MGDDKQIEAQEGEAWARLSELEPEWLMWLCEVCAEGADEGELKVLLSEQGEADPQGVLRALKAHPIYRWARERERREARSSGRRAGRRAQMYRALQEQAWGMRAQPLTRLSAPSAEHFFEEYYCALRPVVITDWVSQWPACERWDPSSWVERFADVDVDVCEGREGDPLFDRHAQQLIKRVSLGSFAQELLELEAPSNARYLVARGYALERPEVATLLDDVDERPYLTPTRREGSMALWFGPAGTYTPLHHDTCQIMFAQIWGEKRFTLIPPHAQELFEQATNMYADLPLERNLEAEPLHPHQLSLTLRAGEALFIPVGWWHAVRSTSLSISLAMTGFEWPQGFSWYEPNRGFSSRAH